LVAAIPAILGLVVCLVMLSLGEDRSIRFTMALPVFALVVGVCVSVVGTVVLLILTSRRSAVEQATQAADERWQTESRAAHRKFLARLDHELKNPVTAIRASVAAARDAGEESGPLAVIDAQSTRIASLVSDLRKLAELETAPLEAAPVELEPLIADAVAAVRDDLAVQAGQDRAIETQLPSVPWRLPSITGDVDLLSVALYNLLTNAVKYSQDGAVITVRAMEDSGGVLIEVADTGRGIPAADVEQVWEELARASNARGVPGSGLGLALVKTVVERHGGRVELSSRESEGTSVRIWLPVLHAL
jgi:two-component system OmpR family sensor kinase